MVRGRSATAGGPAIPRISGLRSLDIGPDGTTWALTGEPAIYALDASAEYLHGSQPDLFSAQQVATGEDWVSSIVGLEALPDGGFVAVVKEPGA